MPSTCSEVCRDWRTFCLRVLEGLCPKSGYPCSSLCNLCVLCASVVNYSFRKNNHRDTENTEVAQRRTSTRDFSGRVSSRNTRNLNTDLSKACELLGVKPGVSKGELKAAHRDLAKVWHPDRFLQDPRLQEKAQEKLKEINEAYALLASGRTPRPAPSTPPVYTVHYEQPKVAETRGVNSWAPVVLVFLAVFAVTITLILQRRAPALTQQELAVEEQSSAEQSTQPDANKRAEVNDASRKPSREESNTEVAPVNAPSVPTSEMATVTVTIDPETGLLAKPECRLRSRMSYPSGSEPKGFCNLSHAPPPKDGKIKSAVKWLESK